MSPTMGSDSPPEYADLQHSLRSTNLELNLERSKHSVEIVCKDEELRKLRLSQLLLQDEIDDLHEQLDSEQARGDDLDQHYGTARDQLQQLAVEHESFQNQIRTQTREIQNLRAELKAMENVASDTNKILAEKLALTREMSSLKPEVEHLRAQVEANQGLLAEKLALQRQVSTLEVELENEKRNSNRALARQGKRTEQAEELRNDLEELRKELTNEKSAREKAESALDEAHKTIRKLEADMEAQTAVAEEMQIELDKTRKKEAKKASKQDERREAEIEKLKHELEQARRERLEAKKTDKVSDSGEIDALRKELEEERRIRMEAGKEAQKSLKEMENRNTVLDDKLNAFRDKLRSTKERLKEAEAKLKDAQKTTAPVRPSVEPVLKKGRKRAAASVEPEATTLGTPGDGFPAKRTKRNITVAAVGDKSTFSITPFLNRTSTIIPGSPIEEAEDEDGANEEQAGEATPTAPPKKVPRKGSAKPKTLPLAPSASSKANAKSGSKAAAQPTLEKVSEDPSEQSDSNDSPKNAVTGTKVTTIPTKGAAEVTDETRLVPKIKPSASRQPRKSLLSFAAFNDEPAPQKKKRKLGAGGNTGLGKTLFDDEENTAPAKPIPGKGLFAARALGKSILGKGPHRPISGGYNMLTEEGFTFSPLKKDRKRGKPA